jgi:cation transport ATPase
VDRYLDGIGNENIWKLHAHVIIVVSALIPSSCKQPPQSAALIKQILFVCVRLQWFAGYFFYKPAFQALRHGSSNMNVLIALGSNAAYLVRILVISRSLLLFGAPYVSMPVCES